MTAPRPASSGLPGTLAEIADHAGRDAALAIALAHGGQVWRVPARADSPAGQALAETVGPEAAAALVRVLGGHVLEIPLARRQVVRWLARDGIAARQIAARLHMSVRVVRRYLKAGRDRHG